MATRASSGKIKITAIQNLMFLNWGLIPSSEGDGPGPRWGHTLNAIEDGESLYLFGGYGKDGRRTNQLHIFEAGTLSWTEPEIKGNPPTPRDSHSCTTVGDYLFVFGGTDGTTSLNDLHILNTQTHSWAQPNVGGTIPEPRAGHIAAYANEKLFIFGGRAKSETGDVYYNDLHILNAVSTEFIWTRIAATPTFPSKRVSHTCWSWKHQIIVVGGEDSSNIPLSDVYVLDAETLMWRELKTTGELLPARAGHTTIGLGKFMIVFGGYSQEHQLYDDVHVLDIEDGKWTKMKSAGMCPSARFFMAGDSFALLQGEGAFALFGGCNKNLEPLGDMYYLLTGICRRAERKSLRKRLQMKSQEQPTSISRCEVNPVEVEHVQGTTSRQCMPISLSKQLATQDQCSSEVLHSDKKTFRVTVTNSFSHGYNVESVIDGLPYYGVLNKPIFLRMDENRKFKVMKAPISGNPHSTDDIIMESLDSQKEPRGSKALAKVSGVEMKNRTADGA